MGMQSEIHRKLAGNRNSWECSLSLESIGIEQELMECSLSLESIGIEQELMGMQSEIH